MAISLEDRVRQRANGRCEYCQLPQAASPLGFQIDHVIARQHGGTWTFGNLALSCPHCNAHKGPNIGSRDPTGRVKGLIPLFNPRRHRWSRHFLWEGPTLRGLTAIGRATIQVLDMNDSEEVALREALIHEGIFPPPP
jgi:hypothetical protein